MYWEMNDYMTIIMIGVYHPMLNIVHHPFRSLIIVLDRHPSRSLIILLDHHLSTRVFSSRNSDVSNLIDQVNCDIT